ncbi:MAG TPA: glycosyltransferase family 39 protein [Candidatus Dormibacteraeota bacterium]|nr:glycosyltransferase family 39 protein [Candidatus Dormibacteraeota bacterium]
MTSTPPAFSVSAPRRQSMFSDGMAIVWGIALAKLVFHIYFNNRYGYFRDEFDYMSCGDHLQWGYVDQPPLIPFLIHISRSVLGDSLRAIRFIPAISSALLVVQAAAIARELGGRTYALILTAICVALAPQYLSNGGLLGTNNLEPTLWMGCAYFAILAIKRNDPRYWIWFGVSAGLGMEEKYTIAVFGLGIVIGLMLTEQRRVFLNQWIWIGGVVAFLIFLPNILWNWHYDWPFVQLIRAIRAEGRDVVLGPSEWFFQQLLVVGPIAGPVWLTGLFALLFWKPLRPYRVLGWSYLVSYLAIDLQHGKNYYLGPIYPMLFAAGAVALDSFFDRSRSTAWLKPVVAIVIVVSGLYFAPITVPILSPDRFIAYTKTLPFKLPINEHSHARAPLPQWYSDQFGWKEISDETVVAWNRIPAAERADCGIFAQDYGQAGAIDFFGRREGLPGAMSGDRTYWLWGPHNYSGNCMIVLDDRKEVLDRAFNQVEFVGLSAPNAYALEQQIPVFICKGKKFDSWAKVWPRLKRWR